MSSTSRSNVWSLTINNPTADDEECIQLARQKGWKVEGQKEVGKEGTPHYQLMLKTPQVRFSAVKKFFPRAHIEIARNAPALAQYVTKEDTRTGHLPSQQEMYPSFTKYMILVSDYIVEQYNSNAYEDEDEYPVIGTRKREPLMVLDDATKFLIRQGYQGVSSMAVNPSTRSQWKTFHKELFHMARLIKAKDANMSQTDRQTDTAFETESIVSVPTINGNDEEVHEEAVDTPPPPPPPGNV